MSTHPNVMLQCVLTVDDGSRKTERALLEDYAGTGMYDDYVKIADLHYKVSVMGSDYDEGYQISADEGQIVLHEYLTYGYGETVDFETVCKRAAELKEWAESAKEKHKFSYVIRIGANYW